MSVKDTLNESLYFTSRVLGPEASQRLKDGKVTQTVRSRKSAAPFLTHRSQMVKVTLDGVFLFEARITEIKRTKLSELTQWDAEIGGFSTLEDLKAAAKRAGFRFKADYELFRIQFLPQRGGGKKNSEGGLEGWIQP